MATLNGTAVANLLNGTAAADTISGLGGNDTLNGNGGNDRLDGGTGNDRMVGGAGNDLYIVNSTLDLVVEGANAGTDTVQSSVTHTLAANVENLTLTGATAINGTGNTLNNVLTGNSGINRLTGSSGNDTLNGAGGKDTLIGGTGNDTYIADSTDVITETAGQGTDTLQSTIARTLSGALANIENLTLTGSANVSGTGNGFANILTGNTGNNLLTGGGGADRLNGGAGNDTLVWDAADLKVDGGTGADTLRVTGNTALDLTTVGNTKIVNVETIDLMEASGTNTLTLAATDVLALSGSTDTVTVRGGGDDTVNAGPGWLQLGNDTIGDDIYAKYTKDGATLLVDLDIDRSGIGLLGLSSLGDLNGATGFRISGTAGERSGWSVSGAGDVNGDGLDDLIIGAPFGSTYAGASYVVFGSESESASALDLTALNGSNGFRVDAIDSLGYAGFSVSDAGDVNGDGIGDFIIGTPAEGPGSYDVGASYVVFGQSGFASALALSSLDGGNGFRIVGEENNDRAGFSVASAGDVNQDGYDDVIVGARGPNSENGSSYVVFGMASGFGAEVQLSTLDGTDGFKILEAGVLERSGWSVSAAGDVNGDGIGDIIVGAKNADSTAGASYVVFGNASGFSSSFNLGALTGANGFRIAGVSAGDYSGVSVSAAGDVNGDGIGDLVVGAYFADPSGTATGAGYVVFGTASGFSSSLALSSLDGANGFRIAGEGETDRTGVSVSSAGDVNGDGYDDVIVGADATDTGGSAAGSAYLIFGAASGFTASLDLSTLNGTNGIEFSGSSGTRAGAAVSAAGDVNGDGFADFIVGAPGDFVNGNYSGSSFVVFGGDFNGVVDFVGTADADNLNAGTAAAEVFVAGRGSDTLIGGGGADVMRAGAGDDRILVASSAFADVDGGSGIDTLVMYGGGIGMDLTALADGIVKGIEIIELYTSPNGVLTLNASDLMALSDTTNTLRVDGAASNAVVATGTWTNAGTTTIGLNQYTVYTSGAATLQVQDGIDTSGVDTGLTPIFELSALDGSNGFRIVGNAAGEKAGRIVASLGDVNGDGYDDVAVSAKYTSDSRGVTYVVYGDASGFASSLNVSDIDGTNGFRLLGVNASDLAGFPKNFWGSPLSGAGDVNNDGYDDIIIGAGDADPAALSNSGETYVVFGASGFASSLSLSGLNGSNGFRVAGLAAGDESGIAVSSAGDVNNDGYDDVIIGASERASDTGEAYVVFGGSSFSTNFSLSGLNGTNGFRLAAVGAGDKAGISVSDAGDVNGDGIDDLIVGASYGDPNGLQSGESYVVFGATAFFSGTIQLSGLTGSNGFRLDGIGAGDYSGNSVSAAGDINGDGFADIVIGAYYGDPYAAQSGETYVVFGGTSFASSFALSGLNGSNGFRLDGIELGDRSGISVSGAGDVNGDGYDDVIIGSDLAGSTNAGESYVIFGGTSFASSIALSALNGANGFRLPGAVSSGLSGRVVSGGGDVNGDGFDDIIVGAESGASAGTSYVVFGRDYTGAVDVAGTADADLMAAGTAAAEVFVAGQGNDIMSGGGGADVFRGGEGDDTIGIGDASFLDVDGGSGNDKLVLTALFDLDLTVIANTRISGIETIDLVVGSEDKTLTLGVSDVLDLSDTSNTLTVDGDAGDGMVVVGGSWSAGPAEGGYVVYTLGTAKLRIDADIDLIIL